MTGRLILPPAVEAVMPWRGECGLCGGPDARHRVLDAIVERHRAGDCTDIAEDYALPPAVVALIVAGWDDDAGQWTGRPDPDGGVEMTDAEWAVFLGAVGDQ